MIYIYALICPIEKKIRYIGKSIRPKERLQNHMNEKSNCHRSHWLQSIKAKGLIPYMIILQELNEGENWQDCERFWISTGKENKWPLVNNTDGGDGVEGLPEETRKRMALTWTGRKHSDITRKKISESWKNRTVTDATRKKHSIAMKGRVISWVDKISVANTKLSESQLIEIRHRIKNGETLISLSKEYGVARTTMTKVKSGRYPK